MIHISPFVLPTAGINYKLRCL